ncbi:hypothetical protein PMAYCL1PPCAC_17302 [Pristionchus mayeri]|uniref:SXP/RAL-2 family protein Ani s 5-like cation-binding domain-containing protein n=1 Tax=Pristionchus mayeri TaxID=1317129 RepID=A0AAN5CMJ1_9BILA|nr:hypothetical protein PMAYCL1PPCAC_17302 [Pristionchus mayeri]
MFPIIALFSSFILASAQSGGIDIPIPMDQVAVDSVPLSLHFNFPSAQNLSDQAKKEFADIIFVSFIDSDNLEHLIMTQPVSFQNLDAVNLEQTKDEQRQNDMRANVTKALAELPAAIVKLNAIEDNKSLTGQQSNDQTQALFESLKTPYLRRLLEAVSYPDYAEGEEPLFTINMATAKRRSSSLLDLSLNFPPFEKATNEARMELISILSVRCPFSLDALLLSMNNDTLTKGQMETEIKAWAAKNNATEAVNSEHTKDEQRMREMRGNITKAINELPALIAKVTIEQTKTTIEEELKSISNPFMRDMVEAIGERIEEEEEQSILNFSLGR